MYKYVFPIWLHFTGSWIQQEKLFPSSFPLTEMKPNTISAAFCLSALWYMVAFRNVLPSQKVLPYFGVGQKIFQLENIQMPGRKKTNVAYSQKILFHTVLKNSIY